MEKLKTLIICGFPGIGKSHYVKQNKQAIDLESTPFHFLEDGKTINQEWPNNYIDKVEQLLKDQKVKIILLSSHSEVRELLLIRGLFYYLIYPDISLKDEFVRRYRERGNNQGFIKKLKKHWEEWIEQIQLQYFFDARKQIIIKNKDTYLRTILLKKN